MKQCIPCVCISHLQCVRLSFILLVWRNWLALPFGDLTQSTQEQPGLVSEIKDETLGAASLRESAT